MTLVVKNLENSLHTSVVGTSDKVHNSLKIIVRSSRKLNSLLDTLHSFNLNKKNAWIPIKRT